MNKNAITYVFLYNYLEIIQAFTMIFRQVRTTTQNTKNTLKLLNGFIEVKILANTVLFFLKYLEWNYQ